MINFKFDPSKNYVYVRYGRMSDPSQNPRSPEQQFDEIDKEIRRGGYPWIHVCDFRDDGVSGRYQRRRGGFTQMINDIKTGKLKVDFILCDTLERVGRHRELAALRTELQTKYGVLILTADSHFADPTSVAGEALGFFEAMRATSNAHVTAHNVRRGKKDAAKLKKWPGGPIPRGLKAQAVMKPNADPVEVDYNTVVPDPRWASEIQRMFLLARENGWGGFRIAEHLNADPEFVAEFGEISGSSVNFILDNPIYVGTLVFNKHTTDVIDDRRVTVPNEEDEFIVVEDFCEAIIDRNIWDDVQADRRERSRKMQETRSKNKDPEAKQIKPVACGVILKYFLTGLVRCGVCGSSMQPSTTGGAKYFYYRCPRVHDKRCSNSRKIRGDWLEKIFVARLREDLFPLPTSEDETRPPWLAELIIEVRSELRHLASQRQDRRPNLQKELAEQERRITGYSMSLADPDLQVSVRRHIQASFDETIAHKRKLEMELEGLSHEVQRVDDMLDANAAIARLSRLHEILKMGNPTAINIELARHVEAIHVYPNGQVDMRAHRLGVFEGVAQLLATSSGQGDAPTPPNAEINSNRTKPRSRLLARNAPDLVSTGNGAVADVSDHLAFIQLPDRWIDSQIVTTPKRFSWAHLNAANVLKKRNETHWSQNKLADYFNVTPPTIRHAIKLSSESNGDN
ncbi:MAG: recombinase family protein [Phycisphaerae bacterium]|nr:recombinase family protein [Phycisphaerales bacterium]